MYKNILKVTVLNLSDVNEAEASISWLEKAEIVEGVNNYIRNKKLIEIIKEDNHYIISWNTKESYQEFVNEILYVSTVAKLEELGISISWQV